MKKINFRSVCLGALLAALLCFMTAGITACSRDNVAGEWDDLSGSYGKQGFACLPDAGMNIDGYFDEDEWNGRSALTHTEYGVTITLKGFYTEKGMYFAMQSNDGGVVYTSPYGMEKAVNTGFVLSVVAEGDVRMDNFFRVGLDAGNTPRAYGLFSFLSRTTVQGSVNSRTEGMSSEIFIPWENIGLQVDEASDIPENIRVALQYDIILVSGKNAVTIYPGLSNNYNYAKYYYFDRNGYADFDRDDYVLGDAADGYAKSTGYDFSRADEGIYGTHRANDTVAPNMKSIFVRNACAENFVFSAVIKPCNANAAIGGDPQPTAWLIAERDGNQTGFGIDLKASAVSSGTVRLKTVAYKDRVWSRAGDFDAIFSGKTDYGFSDGIPLTLIKQGGTFYYMLGKAKNAKFIACEVNGNFVGASCPGILTSNTDAAISDIYYRAYGSDDAEVAAMNSYLFGLGIRKLSVSSEGSGWAETTSAAVSDGDDANVAFKPSHGSVELKNFYMSTGGTVQDIIDEVKANASGGIYTIENVDTDVEVRLVYGAAEYKTIQMSFTSSGNSLMDDAVSIFAEGVSDKSKYYEYTFTRSASALQLPVGSYNIKIVANGYKTERFVLDVYADGSRNVDLQIAPFGKTVDVNGKTLGSSSVWDYADNDLARAYRPINAATTDIAWMTETASDDFTYYAEITVSDTIDSDPNGGFMISDGSETFAVFLLHNGVRVINMNTQKGWQNRNFTEFSQALNSKLTGKTVGITLSRENGEYTFTANYGTAVISQSLKWLMYSWNNGSGEFFSLPQGNVALGLSVANESAAVFENIGLKI